MMTKATKATETQAFAEMEQADKPLLPGLMAAGELTPTGLFLDGDYPYETWERIGKALGHMRDMTNWALGDWLTYGEGLYGERYAQGVEATGRSKSSLMEYARTAQKVPPPRRRADLSFTHHQLVAAQPPDAQTELLQEAAEKGWSVEEFRGALSARRAKIRGRQQEIVSDRHVDEARVLDLSRRILHEAADLGDGRFAVDQELIVQLRAALDEED